MSEIINCIDRAMSNIDLVLNDLFNMIQLDGSSYKAVSSVRSELINIKSTLESMKNDLKSNSDVIDSKRRSLGL